MAITKDTQKDDSNYKEEVEAKKICFIRKEPRPGSYTGNFNNKVIKIENRQNYLTSNNEEIKFLKNDPEIIQFNAIEKPKKEKK